ncbi:MAG TPA: ABC transporter ATP-binding protein, partial [Rhodospirillales bacterium]
MGTLLEVKNLKTQFFTSAGIVRAVDGISYTVEEGETVALVGESGCGKSVSALSILRLIPWPPGKIVDGEINFAGRNLLALSDKEIREVRGKDISMVFQEPMTSLNPVLSIEQQLTETVTTHFPVTQEKARARALELLEMVGISDPARRLAQYPHHFSGGMRQRVMIAMALACEPKLIIADEPTTALDVTIQAQILTLLRRLSTERGVAVLFTTHDLGTAYEICDRITVMYAGQDMEAAPSEGFFNRPSHPYTRRLLQSLPSR